MTMDEDEKDKKINKIKKEEEKRILMMMHG